MDQNMIQGCLDQEKQLVLHTKHTTSIIHSSASTSLHTEPSQAGTPMELMLPLTTNTNLTTNIEVEAGMVAHRDGDHGTYLESRDLKHSSKSMDVSRWDIE
ncbi:50S ribosomal protein L21 [Striga asiatica]|uniref:50S ribosomal protein L21 n=1 Tax=Striga asiatica TaxID=4170 RepID=A0A5A7QKN2_STRAF|nr:50S ribosomal protein L21 [Striga asiatica]